MESNKKIVDLLRKAIRVTRGRIRPCLKIGNVLDGEGFFRQTRRFDAAILCVLQGKSTQHGGKIPRRRAHFQFSNKA